MKVLHLLGATEDTGGILTVLRNLQAASPRTGVEHVVLVNEAYREARQPALAYRRSRNLLDESPSHLELLRRTPGALRELRRVLRQEPFDAIHGHSRGALLAALAVAVGWRRPVLFSSHAYARRTGMYRWAARRRHLRFSVLTPNMARHYGLQTGADHIAVVSECCADRFFEATLVSHRRVDGEHRIRLVGLGNIVPWKNWHLLLEAFARIPPATRARFEFHHYGPVPEAADCRAYERKLRQLVVEAAPANCQFHGLSLNVEEPLRQADWFVLPSTNEPCSVALIESLALGLPAIASASGGNVDILRPDRTGVLFAPEDTADLARQLQRLAGGEVSISSPAEIRESVRARSTGAVAKSYRALYETVRWPRHR